MRILILCIFAGFMSPIASSRALAQAPRAMSFQGFLTDASDVPIDGFQTITVKLFDASSSGTQVWSRTYIDQPVTDGVFDLILDGGTPVFSGLSFNGAWWVQVEAGVQVLSPRTRLTASPFSMGLSLPIEAEGNVGGGGDAAFKVINTAGSGDNYGIVGVSHSTFGRGVYGAATSTVGATYGVYGQTSSSGGRAVYGWASAPTGTARGVYGRSDAIGGTGVYGWATSATAATYGVEGQSVAVEGRGVYGRATSIVGTNYGVYGLTQSPGGYGGYFTGGNGTYSRGVDNNAPDLILAGNDSGNDDGRIFSDPDYVGSDIWLHTNDAVVIQLDTDGNAEDADFEIRDKDNVNIFNVDESGTVTVNGVVAHSSDRQRKDGVIPVDAQEILDELVALPIHRWRFKGQSIPHVGPMAQDFYASFGVGADDRHIASVDADGVALAAIQALYKLVTEQQFILESQQAEIERLMRIVDQRQ